MAFQDPTLEGVYSEIRRRQEDFGRLSFIEFSDEEYEILLHLGQEIVRCYEYWPRDKEQKARVVFLAFACEYVRHNKYVPDNIFWENFEDTLKIDRMERRNLISYELLWGAYGEEGIDQKCARVNRQIVSSLVSEVWDIPQVTRFQFVSFFIWYYQNYGTNFKITHEIIQGYEKKAKDTLWVLKKAVTTLNKDCKTLAQVIEYAIEHDLSLDRSNLESYRQEIIKALGPECDPTKLRLLRDKEALQKLIIELENHRTPAQFLRELERRPAATVQTPDGKRYPAHVLWQHRRAVDLEYGPYWINKTEYRVVPLSWLRLKTIAEWPYEEIVPLRRGYLGYKKRKSFEVKVGERVVPVRQCTSQKSKLGYIWAGDIPHGERLVVDGRLCQESAGLDWEATLRLGYDEAGEPIIVIGFDRLVVYFPGLTGHPLVICTSQGYEQREYLHLDGSRQFHHAITIPLDNFAEPVTVSIHLGENLLDSKEFMPEPVYLFSCQTHECIQPGTAYLWGENQYYLFSSLSEHPQTRDGVRIDLWEAVFDPYTIYKLSWEDKVQPFSLVVGDLWWNIQKQGYFHILTKQQSAVSAVRLGRHQTHRFSQISLRVMTNLDLTTMPAKCQVLSSGEPIAKSEASKCLQAHTDNGFYIFIEEFLDNLDDATKDHYGRYDLCFSDDKRILDQITLALLPEVNVQLPASEQILPEDETIEVNVSSPHLAVWDPITARTASSATLRLRPKLLAQPWTEERSAKGVMRLTPQAVTAPLIFPAIGETVEISVCPRLFGFRLYQHHGYKIGRNVQQHARYWLVSELDYYALENAALYVFTGADCEVTLHLRETKVWSGKADLNGQLFIDGLGFLKPHCQEECTAVRVVSVKVERIFFIRWKPLIHEMTVRDGKIHLCLSGPRNTGIILNIVELGKEVIRSEQQIACAGERLMVSLDVPYTEIIWAPCYLVPVYYHTDGTSLQAALQLRIRTIPEKWLKAGIGVPSETILQTFITE